MIVLLFHSQNCPLRFIALRFSFLTFNTEVVERVKKGKCPWTAKQSKPEPKSIKTKMEFAESKKEN